MPNSTENIQQFILLPAFYLPPISYFFSLLHTDNVLINDQELYEKQSYRNRCEIYSANGKIQLSIPLDTGRNAVRKLKMKEVKISFGNDWKKNHLSSIKSAYGRAPYFEYYADDIFSVIRVHQTHLFDFNCSIINVLQKITGKKADLVMGNEFDVSKNWIKQEQQKLIFKEYYQSFSGKYGFISNLSILDLIFHKGPDAKNYLLNRITKDLL